MISRKIDGTNQNVSSIDNKTVDNDKMSPSSSDLNQTLLSIYSRLGCMSDLLMKLVAGSEPTVSFPHTQSTTDVLLEEFGTRSTGQTKLLSTRGDANDHTGQIESSSTGHEALMLTEKSNHNHHLPFLSLLADGLHNSFHFILSLAI